MILTRPLFLCLLLLLPVIAKGATLSITLETKDKEVEFGQWSGSSEGYPLQAEDESAGQVELIPGASLRLWMVHQAPTFELIGPTRIGYYLTSTDPATQKLLPANDHELSFHIPPTKLMKSVWAATSQTDREQSRAEFNEFLKFRAQTEARTEDDERSYQQRLDEGFATKTLFYLAG